MFEFKKIGQQQKQRFALRGWVGGLFALACFCVLIGRLWFLQVDRYEGLSERADRNRIAVVPIAPRRGEILDRNGVVMARNYRTYTLEVVPAQVDDIDAMLRRLTPVVYVSPGDQRRFKRRVKESGRYASLMLRNNLNDTEASWFAAHAFEFPGVELRARWVREYPQGTTAGHVVGYIGRIADNDIEALESSGELGNYRGTDVIGKKGIEKSWEKALHGQTGIEEVEVNASGRPVRTLQRIDPVPGVDIMLSIDLGLQRVAEEAFGKHRGALVAIDPNTGEILAFVSKPAFDPNLFIDGIDVENWRLLNESPDHPLINRPLYGTYPIGSTYKPFVALAALELGVRDAKTRIPDPGYYEFGGQRFRNAGGVAYGMTDMHKAIVVSSDTYFYSLGPEIGVDRLHDFSKQFGFGQVTGIDLDGERKGVLPSIEWKRKAYKDRKQQQWYAGETISVAVGQGYNSFTLLQLAQGTSTLANDGAYRRPHLVHATRDTHTGAVTTMSSAPQYQIPLKQENVDLIKNAMVGVVRSGTARRAFAGTDYQAAGKTGTAQVFSLRGSQYRAAELDERLRDHALFMGFAPADKPRIAVALLVENAGWGASVAAPIARTVFDYWLGRPATPAAGSRIQLPMDVTPLSVPVESGTPVPTGVQAPAMIPGATSPDDLVEPPSGVVLDDAPQDEPLPPLIPGSDTPPPSLRPRSAPKPAPAQPAPTVPQRPSTAPARSDLTDLFELSGSGVKP